ncbi:HNH endonuclease [Actinospongicola halichondriae]|uniref:HNH endonuclease n=1 Tax=Actinospongicola halichondriae TaxID=3236844 RepID=UPI003D3E8E8F
MSRALVLNATYEPLSVVSSRRATVLLLSEKAVLVSPSGEQFHSEHLVVDVPSVVRLRQFVKVPFRRRAALNRRSVFARDGHRCQYCAGPAESIDHVIPRAKGGQHVWENVVAACRSCNVKKRDRLLHETSMSLLSTPTTPRGFSWISVMVGAVPSDWQEFLGSEPALTA